MRVLEFLFAWANAPFVVAGGIAVLFALLQATGLLGLLSGGDHDGDAEHDVDVDGDADVDGGGHVEADGDADADGDHDADHDHDADNESGEKGLAATLLGPLGLGKIPFSLTWQAFALAFAVTGLGLNAHYAAAGHIPLLTFAWTLPAGFVSGYALVAILSRTLGPLFASKAQEATSRSELVGQLGVVISSKVTGEFGEVRIKDKSGHDVRVVCRLAPGSSAPKEHDNVVVVEYDEGRGLLVAPLEEDDDESRRTHQA